jgi:hypothetical protein
MKWKAATTNLILSKTNLDPNREVLLNTDHLDDLTTSTLKHLQRYHCSNDDVSFRDGLYDIFVTAIRLDSKINQQWALLVPTYNWDIGRHSRKYDFDFDPTLMENLESDNTMNVRRQDRVQMVVNPGLVRYGTAAGERYDEPTILVKADVLVKSYTISSSAKGLPPKCRSDGGTASSDEGEERASLKKPGLLSRAKRRLEQL